MSAVTMPPRPALPAFQAAATFVASRPQAIAKVRYSHQAMVDMIVNNPWISQAELANNFGYTEGWVSQVIASDAFQAYLEKRKSELIDPAIRATIEERFKGLIARSITVLMRKLDEGKVSDETALKALEIAAKAAGYGPKAAQVQVNTQFVVQVPPKSANSVAWAEQYGASGQPVSTPPSSKAAQTVDGEVLVDSGSAAPDCKALLAQLKGG